MPERPPETSDSNLTDLLESLPGTVSRGLLYIVLAFTLIIVIWAAIYRVNIVVTAPSKVTPEGEVKVIQTALAGTLRNWLVADGETVASDQPLLVYESAQIGDLLTELQRRHSEWALASHHRDVTAARKIAVIKEEIQAEQDAFDRQSHIHGLNERRFAEITRRLELEIQNADGQSVLLGKEYAANELLASKGIVSERDMLALARLKEEANIRIESLRSALRETRVEEQIESANFELEAQNHKSTIARLSQQAVDVRQAAEDQHEIARIALEKARRMARLSLNDVDPDVLERAALAGDGLTNKAVLRAPVSGVVANLQKITAGQVVERGQILGNIVPRDARLVMELEIAHQDIARVHSGQDVKLKFDAFPFAEHGVLTGKIFSISPNAESGPAERDGYFAAISSLDQAYFRVGGEHVPLLPGMRATAEIQVDRRRLLSLALEPFRALGEAREAGQ